MVGRNDSDEFVVLLTDPGADGARLVSARIERAYGDIGKQRDLPPAAQLLISDFTTVDPPERLEECVEVARAALEQRRARR